MAALRRCVMCTGLSVFKRGKDSTPNQLKNNTKSSGTPLPCSPPASFAPPDRSFTCYGVERLAYVQALPADDARLEQPDVTHMWCLGKSVFLLQSSLPVSLTHDKSDPSLKKVGRSWLVTSASEVPISYRGISQSVSVDESPSASASSRSASVAAPANPSSHFPVSAASSQTSTGSREPRDIAAVPVPSLSQLFADMKPYAKESCSMLYEALFSKQSHAHAAHVLSSSLLSPTAHISALRALESGHERACSIAQKTFYKWFGGGS